MPSQASLDTVQNIYIAFYGRPADPAGQTFWAEQLENADGDVSAIINPFATSAEYQDRFGDLSNTELVNNLYLQSFGREAEDAGLAYWVGQIEAGNINLAGVALEILNGAQGDDLETIVNKQAVANAFTAAVAAENKSYSGAEATAAAKALLDGVDANTDPATVDVASVVAGLDAAPVEPTEPTEPTVPGESFFLTSGTDVMTGTAADDKFYAYLQQNPMVGGISNSLSSADRLDGGAGRDYLFAEVTQEFVGINGFARTDIQPRTTSIEVVEFEARDFQGAGSTVVIDAKHMYGLEKIGSKQSDGNLVIENLTTLMNDGTTKRNTSELTITMDHTDNKNSDGDASDLTVYFDDNYLISGVASQGQAIWYILDQDSDLIGGPLLADIDVNGIRFSIDGGPEVRLSSPDARAADNHVQFVAALQSELAAAIADGRVPAGTTLTLDTTRTDTTFLDDGSRSSEIPAIVLTTGDGSQVTPVGFARVEDAIGEYNVYGRLQSSFEVEPEPVSVQVELTKAGRGGEGGDLIVGSKSQANINDVLAGNGIPVINVTVKGGEELPNSLGLLGTTNGRLDTLNIRSDMTREHYASLEIRDSFNTDGNQDQVRLINANEFRGDLTIGSNIRAENVFTMNATGGGDVEFYGFIRGEQNGGYRGDYSYTTGSGNDLIDVILDLSAIEHQDTGLSINAGNGNNEIVLTAIDPLVSNYQNHKDLENVNILSGSNNDTVFIYGVVDTTIETGAGNDTVYAGSSFTGGDTDFNFFTGTQSAVWNFNNENTFNVDGSPLPPGVNPNPVDILDLDGKPLESAVLFKHILTVTFSAAGVGALNGQPGGGVMAGGNANGAASAFVNGIESRVRIDLPTNQYYGTQDDINKAMLTAINTHPVLGQLLVAEIGPDYTLQVRTLIDGVFDPNDLDISITRPTWGELSPAERDGLLAAVRAENNDSTITNADIWGAANPAANTVMLNTYTGTTVLNDAYYPGLIDARQAQTGQASDLFNDNIINLGAGNNDIAVLGTTVGDSLLTSSNDTLVFEGNFGYNTIINFATTGNGIDYLDFTSYLTTLSHGLSTSTASQVRIDTTLNSDNVLHANEVHVMTFSSSVNTQTWDGLNATNLLAALNNNSTSYGDIANGTLNSAAASVFASGANNTPAPGDIVGNSYNSIIMVENNLNLGEYKVFHVTTTNTSAETLNFSAIELVGIVDFGATLVDLSTANLI